MLWRFLLTFTLLTIAVCDAFRLRDGKTTMKRIPLSRVNPDGGFRFLEGADFQFYKEVRELNEFRVRRSAEESVRSHNRTKITDEFELTGDNHSVAFLHWSGERSSVSFGVKFSLLIERMLITVHKYKHAFCLVTFYCFPFL